MLFSWLEVMTIVRVCLDGGDEKREEGRGRVVGIFTIQTTRESLKMSCNGLTKTYYKLFRASELSRIQ